MPAMDVFVPLHPRHFGVVDRCIESIFKHLGAGIGKVWVVSGDLPPALADRLTSLGASLLHEREPLGFVATGLPQALRTSDDGGRLFSQMLKWELRRYSSTPSYVVIDADTILLRPIELQRDGKRLRFRQNRYHFSQIMCFNWCFGLIPNAITPFANDLVSLDVEILNEMTRKIHGRFNLPWERALLGILQQVKGTRFAFAEIYGYYAALNHPESFDSETIRTRRLSLSDSDRFSDHVRQSGAGGAALLRYTSTETSKKNSGPVIRMGTLGYNGRFANQVFQYGFLRLYAKEHQLTVQCPPWVGNGLFGHQELIEDDLLPIYREDKPETEEMIRFDESHPMRDFELWGYFQDARRWGRHKEFFRSLFQPLDFIKKPLEDALGRIRAGGRTLVAVHLRRGDFVTSPGFWAAPEEWYLRWLDAIWPTLVNPVLYVATDDPKQVLPYFDKYQPVTDKQLGVNLKGAEFYVDFYVLSRCDALGISNSTFSFAAAMLNDRATILARPDPHAQRLVEFNPWESPVQIQLEPAAQAA